MGNALLEVIVAGLCPHFFQNTVVGVVQMEARERIQLGVAGFFEVAMSAVGMRKLAYLRIVQSNNTSS
jgi:hypothetical protein